MQDFPLFTTSKVTKGIGTGQDSGRSLIKATRPEAKQLGVTLVIIKMDKT